MTEVRLAKTEDIESVVNSVSGFMKESKHSPFSINKAIESWTTFISSGMGEMFILDDFHGALGGVCYPDPHRDCLVASEFFWYVKPEYRGKGGALLEAFEAWAKEKGCSRVIMTHLSDSMPESLKKYYTKKGYELLETNYIKEVT